MATDEAQSADKAPVCVRCSVEEGRIAPATTSVQHPHAGNALVVCDRHGADLLANGWTQRITPVATKGSDHA